MADEKKTEDKTELIQAAQKEYTSAQRAYDKIVNMPTKAMTPVEHHTHDKKAAEALRDKRYAKVVLDARLNNRPVPERAGFIEC